MTSDQSTFRNALLDPSAPVPDGLNDGAGHPAGRRFSVYRNNVAVSLTEALETGFPVLRKLLGHETFKRLCAVFLRAHPPQSPLMMHYGQDMPAFLAGFDPLRDLGYLADVARLELGLRASYHAADSNAIDPARFGEFDEAALMAARLTLAPAVVHVPSPWPLHDIWAYNTIDSAPKPQAVAQSVLITRPEFDPQPHALDPAQNAWMGAITADETLGGAHDAALAIDPDFDLAPLLGLLLQTNAITDLKT
ncbi:MAG: DNA-binding domain-containing protein [Pseudomonadota bacterium]